MGVWGDLPENAAVFHSAGGIPGSRYSVTSNKRKNEARHYKHL